MKRFTKLLTISILSIAMVISCALAFSLKTNAYAKSVVISGYGVVSTSSSDATITHGTYKQIKSNTSFTGIRLTGKTGATFNLGTVDISSSDWAGTYNATGAPTETDKNETLLEMVFDPHDADDFVTSDIGGSGELSSVEVTFSQGLEKLSVRMSYYSYTGDTTGREILVATKAGKQTDYGSYRSSESKMSGGIRRGRIVKSDFANLGISANADLYSGSWGVSTVALPIYYDFNDVALYTPSQYQGTINGLNDSYLLRDYNSTEAKYNSTSASSVTTWNGFTKDANGKCIVNVSVLFNTVKGDSASSVVITKLGNCDLSSVSEAGEEVTVKNTGNKVTYGSYKQVTSGEYAGLRLAGEEGATFNLGSINLKNTYFDDNWGYLKGTGPINVNDSSPYGKVNGAYYTGGNAVTDGVSALARSFMSFVYDPTTTAQMELMDFTVTIREEDDKSTAIDESVNFITYHVLGYTEAGVTKEILVKCTATNNTYLANERYYKAGIVFNHQVRRQIDCRGAQPKPVGLYYDYSQNAAYTDVAYAGDIDGIYRAFRVRDFDDVSNTSNYQAIPSGIAVWNGFSKEDANVNVTVQFNDISGVNETAIILTSLGGYEFGNQTLVFEREADVVANVEVDLNAYAGYKTETVTLSYSGNAIKKYSVNGGEKFTNSKYVFGADPTYVVEYFGENDEKLGQTTVNVAGVTFVTPSVINGYYETFRNNEKITVDNVNVYIQKGDEIRYYFDSNAITGLPYSDVRAFTLNGVEYLYDTANNRNNVNLPLTYNENGYYVLAVTDATLQSVNFETSCRFDSYCDITFKDEYLQNDLVYYKWSDEVFDFPKAMSSYSTLNVGYSTDNKSLVGYVRKDVGVDYETKETAIREDGFTFDYEGKTSGTKIGLIYYTNIALGKVTDTNVAKDVNYKKAYSLVPGMIFETLYIDFNVDYAIKIEENATGVDDQKSGLRFYVEVDKEDWAKFKFYSKETNKDGKSAVGFYNYITTQSQLDKAGVTADPKTFGTKWMAPGWVPTFGQVNGLGLTCISKNGESHDASNVANAKGAFMFYGLVESQTDIWLDDKFNKNSATHDAYAFVIRNFTDTTQTYVFASFFSASYMVGGSTSMMAIPIKVNLKDVCQEKFNSIVLSEKPSGIYYTFTVDGVKKYSKYTKKHVQWLNEKGGLNKEIA